MTRPVRIAVVYYSATGNVNRLAHALAEGAGGEGAEVRSATSRSSPRSWSSPRTSWGRHRSEVEDEPVATLEDLEWADGRRLQGQRLARYRLNPRCDRPAAASSRASRLLWSRGGEPLTPLRDLWRLSLAPLMDLSLQRRPETPRHPAVTRRSVGATRYVQG
jgi:hypothetical protein